MAEEEKSEKKENSDESQENESNQSNNKSSNDSEASGNSNGGNGNSGKDGEEAQQITIYEWVCAALGCILVFGSIAFMTYKAVVATDNPPDLSAQVKSVEKLTSGYLVKFEVKNNGEYTAAVAHIKGELKKGDKTEESSSTTVAYVPSYSTRSGGIFFTKNPQDYEVNIRATGYTEP